MTSEPFLPVPPPEQAPPTGWTNVVPASLRPATVDCRGCGSRIHFMYPCPRCGTDPKETP